MEGFLIRGWGPILVTCAAGPRSGPEWQISRRAGSMSLSHSATNPWGWSFHTVRDGIDPGDFRFRSRVVGVVEI